MSKIFFFLLLFPVQAHTQQFRNFSQGFETGTFINPGYAERLPLISDHQIFSMATARYRSLPQVSEGPATLFFDGDLYWKAGNSNTKLIAGAHFVRFNTDPIFTNRFSGRIAAALPLKPKRTYLSVGFSPGFIQHRVATERLLPIFPDDPALSEKLSIQRAFILGAGLCLNSSIKWPWNRNAQNDYYYVGYSLPQIGLTKNDQNQINQVTHHYLYAGFRSEITPHFYFEPVVLLKQVKNVPIQAEGVVRVKYKEKSNYIFDQFWIGMGVAGTKQQSIEMMHFEMGFSPPKFPASFRTAYTFSSRSYVSAFNAALELLITMVPYRQLSNEKK